MTSSQRIISETTFLHLLDYTKQRYDSTLNAMLEVGDDMTIDDVSELLVKTHEQLKDLDNMMKQLGCNVYNLARLTVTNITSEHIIPKSLFGSRPAANYWKNIICCDAYTNSMRSNYRLGDPQKYRDVFLEVEHTKKMLSTPTRKIVIDSSGRVSGIVDKQHRIFYPSLQADMGLLSRSIIDMVHKHPFLYQQLDLIVADRSVLYEYYDLPKTTLELSREALFQSRPIVIGRNT